MARKLTSTALVALLGLLGCDENTPTTVDEQPIGFIVGSAGDYTCDTCVTVEVSSSRLLPVIPEVTVNGRAPDSASLSPDWWTFSGFHAFDTVTYRIVYGGDVLQDTIAIPGPIDSLFCNGVLLPNIWDTTVMWIPAIDTTDTCFLSWKAPSQPPSYRVQYNGVGLLFSYQYVLVQDTVLLLPTDTTYDRLSGNAYFSLSIAAREGNAFAPGGLPDRSSGRLFAYYDLEGPLYQANYTFGY